MDLNDFAPAHRSQTNALVMMTGPSNSGKTLGALRFARGLRQFMMEHGDEDPLVAVIDTERKRSAYYWGRKQLGGMKDATTPEFPFLIKEISDNFAPRNYINAIKMAQKKGVKILIIDSITHAWAGKGGMLEQHDRKAQSTNNKFTAWADVDKDYNAFLDAVLQYPGHVIVTVRAKEAHELTAQADNKGNMKYIPKKIGLRPIFREGTRGSVTYEFPVAFRIDQEDHKAEVDKDITDVFDDSPDNPWQKQVLTEMHGYELAQWLHDVPDMPAEPPSLDDAPEEEATAKPAAGSTKSKPKARRPNRKHEKAKTESFAPVDEKTAETGGKQPPEKDPTEVRPPRNARRNAVHQTRRVAGDSAATEREDDLFG